MSIIEKPIARYTKINEPKYTLKEKDGTVKGYCESVIGVEWFKGTGISQAVEAVVAEQEKIVNEIIIQEIIKKAKENGITDLFILDEKFIIDAIEEKIARDIEKK